MVITDKHIGKKISCKIDTNIIKDAEIYKKDSRYYILNNIINGYNLSDSHKKIINLIGL